MMSNIPSAGDVYKPKRNNGAIFQEEHIYIIVDNLIEERGSFICIKIMPKSNEDETEVKSACVGWYEEHDGLAYVPSDGECLLEKIGTINKLIINDEVVMLDG